ncbi:hypothetical protein [Parasitella parasitica]|uniref:RanBD1 domain-containing protein n=1 Tax=Parasitella parasitica TaxID=35722 RepID=A0A0B7MTB5_9FUNG|nr:hypothetical protein [Parasitella parasitica]
MSSPPDSTTDIADEIALNKKRGRAQSVEPASLQEIDSEQISSEEISSTAVSAPKKTKRDEEDPTATTTTVNTIRKNMKDMTTTDKNLSESQSTASSISHDDDDDDNDNSIEDDHDEKDVDEPMTTVAQDKSCFIGQFGGGGGSGNQNNNDEEDWGEFAQDDDEELEQKNTAFSEKEQDEKPKYTFGASSGFGTKGWAATHQTIPIPSSKMPTFSGFGSTPSGFGGFAQPAAEQKVTTASVPSFGSFAKATASPFATAAVAASNALKSTHADSSASSSTTAATTTAAVTAAANATESQGHHHGESDSDESNDHEQQEDTTTTAAFGEGAKTKIPVVQPTQIKTGEEDEDTIYQIKGKLLVLDTASGNWKERGVGTFRINVKEEEEDDEQEGEKSTKLQTRLVMRTDSVYRVILNLQLFPGMKVFIMQDRFVRFAGFETDVDQDGVPATKLVSFALKLGNPSVAGEVCQQIISYIPPTSPDNHNTDVESKA